MYMLYVYNKLWNDLLSNQIEFSAATIYKILYRMSWRWFHKVSTVLPRYINISQYNKPRYDMIYNIFLYRYSIRMRSCKKMASRLNYNIIVKIFFLYAPGKKVSMIFCKRKGVCRSLKQ